MLRVNDDQAGFTLIELLVVVGILAILMAVTIVAINPVLQFQNARNAQRQSDVATILDAIYEYEATNNGSTPPGAANVVTSARPLGALASQTATSTSLAAGNLTLNVPSGNPIVATVPTATVMISGCSQGADNGGPFTVTGGTSTTVVVSNGSASSTSATGCVISSWTYRIDLCANLVPTFMAAMPMDPTASNTTGTQCATTYTNGYTIAINAAGNRYTIAAPGAENGATISATR